MKKRLFIFLLTLSLLCSCTGKRVDLHRLGRTVAEKGLSHTELGHYMGVSLYHAMADLALASGDRTDLKAVEDILTGIVSGEIPVVYSAFEDYKIGGQATAMLAYYGNEGFAPVVADCADRMWREQPRTSSGIMTTEKYAPLDGYWIDIVFTVSPFFLYAGLLENNEEYIDYSARVALEMCSDLYDPDSGLYHQGYNYVNCPGVSEDCWSRGNGWMSMALGTLLKDYPREGRYRQPLEDECRRFYAAVCRWQNENGLWHQEMTDPGSYEETSGSGQLLAGLGAAIECGILDRGTYMPYFIKGLKGLLGYVDPDGSVGHCCRGNCVPGKGRKEDFRQIHYYYNENHSFGPVVLALAQALRLGVKSLRLESPLGSSNNPDRPVAYARLVTERKNDMAWENDRVAFRVYSQIVANKAASGVDFWGKSVDYPIIDRWYAKELGGGSYHVDDGTGCDFYNMGTGRGIGGSGIWTADTLLCPQLYSNVRIDSRGPERVDFTLAYDAYPAGDFSVTESKRVEMICGTSFYKVTHTLESSTGEDMILGVGLTTFGNEEVILSEGGKLFIEEKLSHDTRVGIGSDAGRPRFDSELGSAVIVNPEEGLGVVRCGKDAVQLLRVRSGVPVTYYAGATWTFQQNSGRWVGGPKFWEMTARESDWFKLEKLYSE